MKLSKLHPLYQDDLKYIISASGADAIRGKRILVTGATGMIGTQLIDSLMSMGGVEVIAAGRSVEKAKDRLGEHFGKPGFRFLEQDACTAFDEGLKVDFIVPLASNTHPLAYSKFPVETMMTNMEGARHALDLAARCGATVVYPSSVEIYGNAYTDEAFTEDYTGKLDLSNSRACYTESKRACEALCQSYHAEAGVNVKIARLSRVFGPAMLPGDTKASSQFILKTLAKEDIILKSEGKQYFSYTYCADAVAALLYVMVKGEPGQAYNISCDGCNVHLKDFADICAQLCGCKVVFDIPAEEERKGYSIATNAVLDSSKLADLGFRPARSLRDALERTVSILSEQ